jgi:hypothetical protein
MTSRELVRKTLDFDHQGRIPRQCWESQLINPQEREQLRRDFPADIAFCPELLKNPLSTTGDAHQPGIYIDEWGCVFENLQAGIIGEVKTPIITDWSNTGKVTFPKDSLDVDIDLVNKFCQDTEQYVLPACCPRPFERLQFIRGTENLYIDLALEEQGLFEFLDKIHEFYCRQLRAWSQTDVDALFIMDDWGSQRSLLIDPAQWRKIFKPLYRDYASIAHNAGKKLFMHSDGYILDIYPDLIEIGVDALNSQIFCMGIEKLQQFAGKITFWGEIDRQYLLVNGTIQEISDAVKEVYENLYHHGGVIAQCEFGPGATLDRVSSVFSAWDQYFGS